jgi:8-oxo-dGTP diphosphatase
MAPTAAEPRVRLPIVAARLRLRALSEADIPALGELAGDAEVSRYTAVIPHPYGEDDARAFLAESARVLASGRGVNLAVERIAEPGLIGCVGISVSDGGAEVGYWIGRPFWGQGFASEAVGAVLPAAFEGFAAPEAFAEVMAANPASFRVLEKAGFLRVGEGTGCRGRCAGAPVVRYALGREAWAARRAAPLPVVLVAAVALVDKDGRVLLAERPPGKTMAGLWEFPGGKVRGSETPEAALIRELKEELAIDVAERCLAPFTFASHRYDDFHLLMPLYVCRVWDGIVQPLEGQRLAWVRPARLADYPMPPADRPLVAMLRDFL